MSKNNETKDYYLGLDLGTGSLGWAVTDEQYHIEKSHGKDLWGVRLFNTASTAEERRMFRTARRRLSRRNWRIMLLQEIFAEEINKIDEGFFLRLKESKYTPDDKRDIQGKRPELPYALFLDSNYTDKDYHQQFPSIYHLRKWLMHTHETPDIRLIYLAFHHLVKHRGHFLFSGNLDSIKEFSTIFGQFLQSIREEELDFALSIQEDEFDFIKDVLQDNTLMKTGKKAKLIKSLQAKTICEKAIINLIVGGVVKLADIFSREELNDLAQSKISFADSNYEEYSESIEAELGEQYLIINQAKAIYDWAVFVNILGNCTSISEAKVSIYEKHKKDLAYLKKLVKDNLDSEHYQDIFVKTDEKLANYSAYIGMTKKNGKKCEIKGKRCNKEDFYKYLRKNVLGSIKDDTKSEYLRQELDKETFLPKQTTLKNCVLPYQVHLYELDKIIDNLEDRIPLIKKEKEKIRSIFAFRIPYYVGPLNGITQKNETTNWMQRKCEGKIYPWNFDKIVDREASAELFIRRMTRKCTYLIHEDVLPKNSMLYSKFMVLNELNNLRINGESVSVPLKQKIFKDLFLRHRKVTQKKLKNYLIREGITDGNVDITGIDDDIKGSLIAYHDFKEKLTDCSLTQSDKENIILNITLFGADKKLLEKRLKVLYPELTDPQRKSLCQLSYQGWGNLSQKFLDGITALSPEAETGEAWTIIRTLWETNDNLVQVLSEKYHFSLVIEQENGQNEIENVSYKLVEDYNVSPAVKRQIWQTLQVVKEIYHIMGKAPKRLFIEMAREKQVSKRTVSRKQQLFDLYKACGKEEQELYEALKNTDEKSFRSDRLYLYYTQKGHCMYSGEIINLEDLWDKGKYDIDHIYPQSKVMDDSLDNRVLVKKEYNLEKGDNYPISDEIYKMQQPFWKMLLDRGLISKEKYKRLTRRTKFDETELSGFISRQLVETRQGTKAAAVLLQQLFPAPNTEIVYAKAKITSKFRQDFDLIKVREMNDLHHAKDAYLNIVVGNTYYTKFTKSPMKFIKENPGRTYNLKRMFTSQDVVRNGEIAWIAGEKGTIATVKKAMKNNHILVTRKPYQVQGEFFDQQPLKKGKGQVPLKSSDIRLQNIAKYGGYNKASGAYFMFVESDGKKQTRKQTMEYIPLYLSKKLEKDKNEMYRYLTVEKGLKNPKILIPKIKFDSLFKIDGCLLWLTGRSDKRLLFKPAVQLILDERSERILKKVLKFVQRQKEDKNIIIVEEDIIKKKDLLELYDVFLYKLQNTIYHKCLSNLAEKLVQNKEKFLSLTIENECVVLSQILHLFQCQSNMADLKLIGGSGTEGKIRLSFSVCKQVSIIHQSPTGIYTQEIVLKKI